MPAPKSPSTFDREDYESATSMEWLLRRRSESWNDAKYFDDLTKLQEVHETNCQEDLPRLIVLSYIKHILEDLYKPGYSNEEFPTKALTALVLLIPSKQLHEISKLASLINSHPERIRFLTNLADCLWLLNHRDESYCALEQAIDLYLHTTAADYEGAFGRPNQGFRLCRLAARFGETKEEVLDIARLDYKKASEEEESDGSIDVWNALEPIMFQLVEAGETDAVSRLGRRFCTEWYPDGNDYYRVRLSELVIKAATQGKHYDVAIDELEKTRCTDSTIDLLYQLLADLYDDGEEQRFKRVWAFVIQSLGENRAKLEWKFFLRRSDVSLPDLVSQDWLDPSSRLISQHEYMQSSLIQKAVEAQFLAYLWRGDFNAATTCIQGWPSIDCNGVGGTKLTDELSLLLDIQRVSGKSSAIDNPHFGSWDPSHGAEKIVFWLLALEQDELLELLARTALTIRNEETSIVAKVMPLACEVLGLRNFSTQEEFADWICATTNEAARAVGTAYAAYSLASRGDNGSASWFVSSAPGLFHRRWVYRCMVQGIACRNGIEAALQTIAEDHDFHLDYSGAREAISVALSMIRQNEETPNWLYTRTSSSDLFDGGGGDAWITWAGIQSRSLTPKQLASELQPVVRAIGCKVSLNLAAVDIEYARAFLCECYRHIPLPKWGLDLPQSWQIRAPSVVEFFLASWGSGYSYSWKQLLARTANTSLFGPLMRQIIVLSASSVKNIKDLGGLMEATLGLDDISKVINLLSRCVARFPPSVMHSLLADLTSTTGQSLSTDDRIFWLGAVLYCSATRSIELPKGFDEKELVSHAKRLAADRGQTDGSGIRVDKRMISYSSLFSLDSLAFLLRCLEPTALEEERQTIESEIWVGLHKQLRTDIWSDGNLNILLNSLLSTMGDQSLLQAVDREFSRVSRRWEDANTQS